MPKAVNPSIPSRPCSSGSLCPPASPLANPKLRTTSSAHRRALSDIDTQGTSRDTSNQKVWAEDYYSLDLREVDLFEQRRDGALEIPAPPPATITRPRRRTFREDDDEPDTPPLAGSPRKLESSLTTFLPFRSADPGVRQNSKSPERRHSPLKEKTSSGFDGAFMATLTGDKEGVVKVNDKRGGLSSWFTGSSAPVNVGLPILDGDSGANDLGTTSNYRDANPDIAAQQKLRKRPAVPAPGESNTSTNALQTSKPSANTGGGGMFNFFSSPKIPKNTVQLSADLSNDEFLTLDITKALFPSGQPSSNDAFSPAALKNLQMNAEGILLKLQTAYKLRTLSYHDLKAEKEAVSDELEESGTRSQCLKNQLEDMSRKTQVQENTIRDLANELVAEKKARQEEKEAREKSIALVQRNADRAHRRSESSSNLSVITTGTEDLGVATASKQRKREALRSNRNSAQTDSSAGADSDAESGGAESVFSRSRSPTIPSNASNLTLESTHEIMQASIARVVPNPGQNPGRPEQVQQKSTFQKILGMGKTADVEKEPYAGIGMGGTGCENCRGAEASVAWDTVGLMRAENKGLKERVEELEHAVEGALDLCTGMFVHESEVRISIGLS